MMHIVQRNVLILLLLFSLVFSYALVAQQSMSDLSKFGNMNPINKTADITNSSISSRIQNDAFPVGNTIDAENYFIGPNDILSIQVIPSDVAPQYTIVTSECSIVNDFFGVISLKDLSLKQVRDTLNFIANNRKSGLKVVVSLAQPRQVIVSIRGNVAAQGTYTFPASYSISTAIKFANQTKLMNSNNSNEEISTTIRMQEMLKEKERLFSETGMAESSSYGIRNIKLIRSNGTASIVDLERYIATNNSKYNPFVKEGDEIFVPFEENEYPTISIAGEVLRPASVVYKNGDMLSHLVKLGYGFTENADLDNVILHDMSGAQKKLEVDSLGNLLNEDYNIGPGTAIVVGTKPKPSKTNFGIVSVKGEVNKPTIYVIELNETKLSDAIEMAEGFTDEAYLPLATITRRDNTQNERITLRRKYREYFQHSNMTQQDTARFSMEIDLKKSMVSSDFVSCFDKNNSEADILLQDGDLIFIPQKPNKVNVFGQINKPGFVDFEENQTMDWYISKAGGYAANADKKRTSIIRGNNKIWIDGSQDSVFVNDGDEIFVPSPRDVPPEMEWQKWAAYAGIAGVIMSFVSVVVYGIIDRTRR